MKILARLVSFARAYYGWMILSYLCMFAVTGFNLVVPSLIQKAIDQGLPHDKFPGDPQLLEGIAITIVVLYLVKGIFWFGQGYLRDYASQRFAYEIRNRLYNHLQRLSFAYHDRAQTGQIMSRVTSDVEVSRVFVGEGLMNLLSVIVLGIGALVLMFRIHVTLTLLTMVVLPVLIFVSVTFGQRMRPLFTRIQQQFANMVTVLQENLSGVRVVKAFVREEHEEEKFERENWLLMERNIETIRVMAMRMPLMNLLIAIGIAINLWYGGHEVIAGRLTIGELVQFNSYLALFAGPVRQLGYVINIAARAVSGGERLFEILDAKSKVVEKPDAIVLPPVRGDVKFDHVYFGYDPDNMILQDMTIDARSGQIVALVGPTGSGKSSVISLIPRFYDVTEGCITIDGYDIRDVTLESLRSQIGIVLQESFLFSSTIRDNIAYGRPDATMEEVVAAAIAARAHDFIMSFPEGYETPVGERGTTLSGGQKQRVAIARALLLNPRVLLLDDSTASVDTETEHLIQEALAVLMKGRTTFVIAQRLSTIKNADQILVLERGRIVERGTHKELLENSTIYRHIYDLQLRDQEELLAGEQLISARG